MSAKTKTKKKTNMTGYVLFLFVLCVEYGGHVSFKGQYQHHNGYKLVEGTICGSHYGHSR